MNTLPVSVTNLLRHSWRDIDYTYSLLTPAERECISEGEFNLIVDRIRRDDAILARSVPITGPIPLVEIPND
tara:strand:+ start:145 stop:360 length:216 start_codon:yes stop_codon:yes gene_type:complete